jgi:hypothetical protein
MSVEKIKTISTHISGIENATRAIFVMLTINDKNINGDPVDVSDSHVHLALGNTKASLEQYGYIVSNCAWIADLPSIKLKDGETARVLCVTTMEKNVPDVVDTEEIIKEPEILVD